MYICPRCKDPLEKRDDAYLCLVDRLAYPRFVRCSMEFVVFNPDIAENGVCNCILDGKQRCDIVIDELRIPITHKDLRPNSRATKYLKKFCGTGKKILDLGCSEGEIGHWLGDANEVTGLDICPKRIARVFSNDIIMYKSVIATNGFDLPFENDYFDIVAALEVIEHTLDTRGFIQEIYRILKPGGKLLISCPNLVSIWNRISLLFGSGLGIQPAKLFTQKGKRTIFNRFVGIRYPDQDVHLRFFTSKSLAKFLESYNFKKKYFFGSDPIISNLGLGRILTNWCESAWGVFEKI